jgi:hypothetical protein
MLSPLADSCLSNLMILNEVEESNPLVGSSINMRDGLDISSYPIEIRFLSPPETPFLIQPPIIVVWHCCNESLFIILSTCFFVSSSLSPSLILHANSKSSLALHVSCKISSYCTKAAIFPKSPPKSFLPLILTVPLK